MADQTMDPRIIRVHVQLALFPILQTLLWCSNWIERCQTLELH
jgi:hypothetical protein